MARLAHGVVDQRQKKLSHAIRIGTRAGLNSNITVMDSQSRSFADKAATLAAPGKREAVFRWTDYVALEVLSVAGTSRLSVPGDVAVVGHDNTMYCAFDQNSLTSIDQSGEQLGLQAIRLLVERIEGRQKAENSWFIPV